MADYKVDIVVRDVPGTMLRVAQIFARRGCNIDSIKVEHQEATPWSQMMIAFSTTRPIDQIVRQLEKLIDVRSVTVQTGLKKE